MHYYYSSFACIDEQKNAEERLEESQSALREAMANSDVQFFTYFPGQRRCRVYAVSSRMGDMPTKWDNFPDDFLRFVHAPQDSAQAYRDMLQRIDAGADDAECIVRFAGSGQYTWEKVSVRAVCDREGRTVRAQGHSINITQRKTAEERLRQERARLKSLEGNIVEACSFSVASLGDWKSASKGTAEPGGESTPDAGGVLAAIAEQIPDQNERERFAAAMCGDGLKKACAEGRFSQTFEYRRCLNGALRCVSTSVEVLPDPETGDNVAFLYTRDVHDETVRRRLDELIVTRNYVTVAYCDLCTGLLHVKSACGDCNAALDGLAYEEAMTAAVTNNADKAAAQTIRGELALSKVRAALEDDPVYTVYFSLDRHDDKLPGHPCVRVKCDIFYLDERRDVLAILISDVTAIFEQNREHREKMASALAAAEQASVAKTEFLSRMSHEIRTPMNAIIGLDAIALQEKDISPAMEDHLQKIGISARFLLSLINDILDMSRIESGRMMLKNEDFDFEELINGINTIMYEQCRDSGLDYDCVLKSYTEESFVGDKIKLQQVLVNILGNAVKFTPRGGKVHFMIEQVLRTREKATLRFEISDTGIGIDEKFIPHMFEAFSQENRGRTSAYGGMGLGLSISRNIVNLMGGDITVHSIKNVGTEFTVEVELGLSQKTINRRGLISPDKLLPLLTLVVDDDVIVCRHTQMLLCDAGLKAEWIDSGMGAIQKVTEHHEQERDYDLILLDWKMPDMDGIETARRIRRIVGPEVTIIIMTAYDWADIEKKARAAGVDMFMKKPVFASSVTRAFENVFLDKWTSHEPEEKQEYDFTGRRVLLAEDNEINAEIAKNILEMRGCDVEIAENGAAAIEAFAASGVGHFNAILMDVRMPVMDGLEAAKAIRAMKKADSKTVPIIAMTANAFQEDVNMSLEAGMNAHLAKPIDPDMLYETIEKFINSCRDR